MAADRSHPDVGPGILTHPERAQMTPLVIEPPGKPSKWITLKALRVLKRVRDAAASSLKDSRRAPESAANTWVTERIDRSPGWRARKGRVGA